MPPVVAPEGDLVFRAKPSFPLYLFIPTEFTFVQPTGVLGAKIKKKLGNPL
jgi:hypothetical protein